MHDDYYSNVVDVSKEIASSVDHDNFKTFPVHHQVYSKFNGELQTCEN